MRRSTALISAAAVTAVAVPAVLLSTGSTAAGGSTRCVAHGTLPGRVWLGPSDTTVHSTLRGTSGCTPGSFDNGGSAVLDVPGTSSDDPLQWSSMGSSDSVQVSAGLDRAGTYRLRDGSVQEYNADEERIPSSWQQTSFVAKYAARFAGKHRADGVVSARLQSYDPAAGEAWVGGRGVQVVLEERLGSDWRYAGRTTSGSDGAVAFRVGSGGRYRFVSASTSDVWGVSSH